MLSSLEQELLGQVLSYFPNLTNLIIPTITNSEILEIISASLPKLKALDISCSTNVTDFGLMSLIGTNSRCKQSLKSLFLEATSSTTDGIFVLLANLPNLEVMESSLLERALDLITDKVLNLRKVTIGRFWRGNEILKHLPEVCPKLCQVILPNITQDQCVHLQRFNQMSQLLHVHIGQVKFEALVPLLTIFGHQLKTLTYSNFTETVHFARIIENCPQLECLGLNTGSIVCPLSELPKMPSKLTEVRLNVHAFIGKVVWSVLFSQCHDLIYIDMTPAQELTDANLLAILNTDQEALGQVKSFIIRGRHRGGDVELTERSIEALTERCDKLRCLGDCSTWNLKTQGIKEFLYFA